MNLFLYIFVYFENVYLFLPARLWLRCHIGHASLQPTWVKIIRIIIFLCFHIYSSFCLYIRIF